MNFPIDIMIEILVRLPAKSLIRFKSVSKLWYKLINGSKFVNLHLERSIATKTNLHFVFQTLRLHLADFGTFDNPVKLNYPFNDPDFGIRVIGTCNGLLCLQSYDNNNPIVIYNPTTQTYKKLPVLDIGAPLFYLSTSSFYFGFGYDSISQDYKCVMFAMDFSKGLYSLECGVMVYSLNHDLWRKALSPSVPYRIHGRCVFLNDTIHWVGVGSKNEYSYIVAFSLRDETFSILPIPNSVLVNVVRMFLGVFDGCLCLSITYLDRDSDIWVMKEYGMAESWTRLFSIPKCNGYALVERPISYSMNSKELFVQFYVFSEVASIDLDTLEIRDVKAANLYRCADAHICVENLLMLEDRNDLLVEEEQHIKTRLERETQALNIL